MTEPKAVSQINVTVNVSTEAKKEPQDRKAYDDREVKPGEVLVPMMAFPDRLEIMDVNPANIRTWHNAGRDYEVIFYPVPVAYRQTAMQQFASELNEFLGENRDARCLIPQEDGSVRVCPKKNGDNRCACADCPHNGEYEREDKTIDSLDALMDEFGYEPAPTPSAEEEFMLGELFEELMKELHDKYPREEKIVTMFLDDADKKAIIDALKLGQSQGYNVIAKTVELVTRLVYNV